MRVFTNSAEHLQQVSLLLQQGEVVAIPTETVYGLAADALNPKAVAKIYEIKGRPSHNPLIIHVPSAEAAETYVETNAAARKLMQRFWPGPLTLVLPKKPIIPAIVTAGLETVGIRCPDHPDMLKVLQRANTPLAAPSANPSNYVSPTNISHVVDHLTGKLEYALDGGSCSAGVESTIIDICDPQNPRLLRPGPIKRQTIEALLQTEVKVGSTPTAPHAETTAKTSPGQLKLHYSPHTSLSIQKSPAEQSEIESNVSIAFIKFTKEGITTPESFRNLFFLSENSDIQQAESQLYALLQKLDRTDFQRILVDPIPNGPEWDTIQDRLTRASSRG